MAETDDRPNWNGTQRRDGLWVGIHDDDTWHIIPPYAPAITDCPHCGSPFATKRAAMLVADAVVPMSSEPRSRCCSTATSPTPDPCWPPCQEWPMAETPATCRICGWVVSRTVPHPCLDRTTRLPPPSTKGD